MTPFKIILTDDHQMFRDGLRALLEKHSDIQLIGEAKDLNTLQIALQRELPDLLILDISYEDKGDLGFSFAEEVVKNYPEVKILVVTMDNYYSSIRKMKAIGVAGYILKEEGFTELTRAIETIRGGEKHFSQKVKNIFFENFNQKAQEIFLTKREQEVLRLITKGHSSKEIGELLHIAKLTADQHRKNLITKTSCGNAMRLVRWGMENGYD